MKSIFSALGLLLGFSALAMESPIGFEEAIEGIKGRSPRLNSKNAALAAAESAALAAKALFLPSLSLQAAKNWSGNLFSDSESRTLSLRSDLTLWSWGSDLAAVKATNRLVEASEHSLQAEDFEVEVEALQLITAYLGKKRTIEISEKLVETGKRLLGISEIRYRKGILARQEVEKIQIDVANAESTLSKAQEDFLTAQGNLEAALGHSQIKMEWPWKDRIQKFVKEFSIKAEIDPSVRPDWRTAQAQMEAQEQVYKQAQRKLLPSLGGAANWGHLQTSTYSGPNWSAALTISFPLFDHLETYANSRREYYNWVAREADFLRTDRKIRAEMLSIQRQTQINLQSAINRDRTYSFSQKLYEQSVNRFELGRASANDLAIDQRRTFDAELLSIDGWSEAHMALLRYCHAFGKTLKNCF